MTVVFALCKCRSAEAFSLIIKMKVYKRCDFNRELHIFYFIFIFLLNSRVGIAMGKFANEVNNCGRRSQGNIWVVLMGVPRGSLRLKWIGRRTYLISIWWCHSTYKCIIFCCCCCCHNVGMNWFWYSDNVEPFTNEWK